MENLENKRIMELPKHVADKIAAGEVVDRPLSIVKELVENSIDAGATAIVVEIRNGGKTYIRVTDNGCGISKEDVELAFKRHATSKIKEANDLDHINSLGFRGEALASIAAVSRTELITKTANEKTGIRVKIQGGEILEKVDTGCPDGTTIIIEDLFFNTPARLKFMKPDSTESTLIIDFISKMTLAYPQIKIRLINNGNILFSTAGKGDIYSNILTIYSKEVSDKLIHLKNENENMSVEAYVSAPNNSKTNRKSQIFFVNGRYISSKIMENAVSQAYLEKLFEGRYPITFIFFNIAPEKVDVNIHPNKKEVRFDDERAVRDFLADAIRASLKTKDAIPEFKISKPESVFKIENKTEMIKQKEEQVDIKRLLSTKREIQQTQAEVETEIQQNKIKVNNNVKPELPEKVNESKEVYENQTDEIYKDKPTEIYKNDKIQKPVLKPDMVNQRFDISQLQITGSIFGTYITAADESNLYLIDQHAAHERVFYEELLSEYNNSEKNQQIILTPFVVNVTHAVKNNSAEMLDFLCDFGFDIQEFGPTAYIIKAIPVFMEFGEAKEFIEYLLDNISEDKELENQKKIENIITNACKKSVKAHDLLDKREIEQLMADLAKTQNPYSCPHGRPTFIKLSQYEIEKMFKRV